MTFTPPVLQSNDTEQRVLAFCLEEEYEKKVKQNSHPLWRFKRCDRII